MKIVRFEDGHIDVTDGRKVEDVSAQCGGWAGEWIPVGINRLIRDFVSLRPQLAQALQSDAGVSHVSVRLETPLSWPNKLIAYPINCQDHAREMATQGMPTAQRDFLKANSSLAGPDPGAAPTRAPVRLCMPAGHDHPEPEGARVSQVVRHLHRGGGLGS